LFKLEEIKVSKMRLRIGIWTMFLSSLPLITYAASLHMVDF